MPDCKPNYLELFKLNNVTRNTKVKKLKISVEEADLQKRMQINQVYTPFPPTYQQQLIFCNCKSK